MVEDMLIPTTTDDIMNAYVSKLFPKSVTDVESITDHFINVSEDINLIEKKEYPNKNFI